MSNASGNEQMLRDKGVKVDILEDPMGIELYAKIPGGKTGATTWKIGKDWLLFGRI